MGLGTKSPLNLAVCIGGGGFEAENIYLTIMQNYNNNIHVLINHISDSFLLNITVWKRYAMPACIQYNF